MADDFKALIEEQKKTTRALMSAEERAEMDSAIEAERHQENLKNENKVEAGRRAWQTRQSNKEASAGGAAAKETEGKAKAAAKVGVPN